MKTRGYSRVPLCTILFIARIAAGQDETAAKALLAETIIASSESPGRTYDRSFRRAAIQRLMSRSLDELRETAASDVIAPMALGDSSSEMVYTALPAPCRIIDTRAVQILTSGSSRNFYVAGGGPHFQILQGGNPAGCGIPLGPATAVVINFVAVNPAGAGNLRGSAWPNPVPAIGSIINYQALSPNLNVANAVVFPICDNGAGSQCLEAEAYDITIEVNGAGVHLVADVLGYFARFPTEQVRSFTVKANNSLGSVLIGSACTWFDDLQISVNAPVAGQVHVRANVILQINHTSGAQNYPLLNLANANAVCSGSIGLDRTFFADPLHVTSSFNPSVTMDGVFDVPAGIATFYVNGLMQGTGSDTARFLWGGMTATFHPTEGD